MSSLALTTPRFLRKTTLAEREYRKNFRQIDNDVIAALTSPEADSITPLMSKIYLRLVNAPSKYFEATGVLRFAEEIREGKRVTAWKILCDLLNVSGSTANKAIKWMADKGIIGYYAGKNGAGLRIFFNRAAASVGTRPASEGEKILPFSPAPSDKPPASPAEAGFSGSSHTEEILELDISDAPQNGADQERLDTLPSGQAPDSIPNALTAPAISPTQVHDTVANKFTHISDIVKTLKAELEPSLRAIAAQAASREHERTREWLENRGLPKAARVAQREAFNVLRQYGVIKDSRQRARTGLMVGKHEHAPYKPKLLTPDEIKEVAEICASLLGGYGQAIDVTLAEISTEAGGYLLAEDAPRVREMAELLALQKNYKE